MFVWEAIAVVWWEKCVKRSVSQLIRNQFLLGRQFAVASWTNHKVLMEFSEIRGLSANSVDCATFAATSKMVPHLFVAQFVLTTSSGLNSW